MWQQFLFHLEFRSHASTERRVGVPKFVPPEALFEAKFLGWRQDELSQDRLPQCGFLVTVASLAKAQLSDLQYRRCYSPKAFSRDYVARQKTLLRC
jgi:hypothetical protein